MSELLATVSGAEVKVWRPDAQHADNIAAAAVRCDVHCIQWSPTNGALACGGSDGRAHLLKPSGELLGRIPDAAPDDGYDGRPGDAHTDGRETGSSNASHPPIRALAFSKGSRYLATAGASTEVTIWDLKRKQKLKTLSGHADAIAAVQYSPGDTHVASAGRKGVVVLHSPVSGLVVGTMVTPGVSPTGAPHGTVAVSSLHYSPHRRQLLASASSDGAVRVWDTGVRRLTTTLSTGFSSGMVGQNSQMVGQGSVSPVTDARFSPRDAHVIAAARGDGSLVLLDTSAPAGNHGQTVGRIAIGAPCTSVAWRGDGLVVAVGASDGRVVWIDRRMLSSNQNQGGSSGGSAMLYTTVAHVGRPVTSVRWQHAVDMNSVASSTAAEASTPTPMRGSRADDNALATTPVGGALFGVENGYAMDTTPATMPSKEASLRRAAELEEASRKRVERLLSQRGASGTPDAFAAAARPTRSGIAAPASGKLSLTPGSGTRPSGTGGDTINVPGYTSTVPGPGTTGLGTTVPGNMDVPGTLAAIAEAITETRRATTSAVRDVHVELLRQMHELGEAQRLAFSEIKHAQADLAKEVAALRRAQLEFVRR